MLINLDFFKTFLNFLKTTPRDWEEKNKESLGYIKNKPFYISQEAETNITVNQVLPETTLEFTQYTSISDGSVSFNLEVGKFYTVNWNGVIYEDLECKMVQGLPAIGTSDFSFQDCPILIAGIPSYVYFGTLDTSTTSHTISIDCKYIEEIPEEMYVNPKYPKYFQSNWDENDETKLGYIKNKPFDVNEQKVVILPQTEHDFSKEQYCMIDFSVERGKTYFVTLDGVEYECTGWYNGSSFCIGGEYSDVELPAYGLIEYTPYNNLCLWYQDSGVHTIEISVDKEIVVTNEKYKLALQSNWDENDENNASFIKNKPFYDFKENCTIIPETTIDIDDMGVSNGVGIPYTLKFKKDQIYTVTFNGTEYKCVCWYSSSWDQYIIGNGNLRGDNNQDGNIGGNGEPFAFSFSNGWDECDIYVSEEGNYTFKVESYIVDLKKIDDKYQHQADWSEIDKSKASYILNKPFGKYISLEDTEMVFYQQDLFIYKDFSFYNSNAYSSIALLKDEFYKVNVCNETYNLICKQGYNEYTLILGNLKENGFEIYYNTYRNQISMTFYNNFIKDRLGTDDEYIIEISIEKCNIAIKKIDSEYLPDNLVERVTNHEKRYMENQFGLRDDVTGIDYIVKMHNGNLVYFKKCTSIRITSYPTNTNVIEGNLLNTTGMVIMGTHQDGSESEITNYKLTPVTAGSVSTVITYEELGETYSVTVDINVMPIEEVLIDFNYNANSDGTYTITGWKGTLNGETSTRMIVPNSSKVIF